MWFAAILYLGAFVLFCVYSYRYMTHKPPNFPPGPPRLPFWGTYIFSLVEDFNFPHLVMQKWAKKYGNVFGMYLGSYPTVMCCDYESCKEVLTRVEFDGRPDLFVTRLRSYRSQKLGIFFTDGPFWHEQRRFSLRHLRDYGFGRRFDTLETLMSEQIQNVIDFIKYPKHCEADQDILRADGCVKFPEILFPTQMNSIMSMFGMEPALIDTERYRTLREIGRGVMYLQHGAFAIGSVNLTPWVRYLAPQLTGYNDVLKSNSILFPFFKMVIEEIKQSKVHDDEVRNFFDLYFKRMEERDKDEDNTFSDDQLLMLTIDYMFPAVTAVTVQFVQIMFSLLNNPECQEKMQKEIDDVVGRGRLPTIDDRKDMPYTESVIRESIRKEVLVPLGVLHRVVEDTTLNGYSLPKDTLVYTSIYGAHMDEKVWGDPENYRPERFMDSNGKLLKKDMSIPFGAGKRLCAGETFARNSLFMLTSAFYQNFNFKMPRGVKTPNMDNKVPGLINSQKDECWVHCIPRD